MKEKMVKDAHGFEYRAYVGRTKQGIECTIDADLADLFDDPEAMLKAEVLACEKEMN